VRAEYSLDPLGWTLTQPLMALTACGDDHGEDVPQARIAVPVDTSARSDAANSAPCCA
jgi:DNA-binding HxlR family transcriptional regulator